MSQRVHRVSMEPKVNVTVSDGVVESMKQGIFEADGTHYSAIAVPVKDFEDRFLGGVEGNGFIIINGINRTAYLIKRTGYLDVSYIMEKFKMNQFDSENFLYLLRFMIPSRDYAEYYRVVDEE